jgi:Pyridoxamine 5'-phosphate oxidase
VERTDTYYYNRATKILKTIQYATLATVCTNGRPWNSPVWAMHDTSLTLYWFSDKRSQHARNVRYNGRVFIVIYDSTLSQRLPTGDRNGLYIQARAYEVADPAEIRVIRQMKKGRTQDDPRLFMGAGIRRVYKAVPERVWMNDAEQHEARLSATIG